MTLLELYQQTTAEKGFSSDSAQIAIITEMQRIIDALAAKPTAPPSTPTPSTGLFARLFGGKNNNNAAKPWIKGLYCWGGVGRGKTFLMDLFMQALPTERKRRRHFHRFMLEIQDRLNALSQIQNPIDKVVADMAQEIDILCLDEFFVSDITHAMLLDRLLHAMQQQGIIIVTTSNIAPQDLYKNGLQRERFLPAIAWIEQQLIVHRVPDGEDFRRRHFSMDNIFRSADSNNERQALIADLAELTGNAPAKTDSHFQAGSRQIPLYWRNQYSIAFDFAHLCQGNYSQKDYIEIAKRFAYVGIVGVPVLDEYSEDAACRLLLLIDEFYDRRVKLLLTTAAPIEQLYQGKKMQFEYQRLQSRLFEMQSEAYWQEAHLA